MSSCLPSVVVAAVWPGKVKDGGEAAMAPSVVVFDQPGAQAPSARAGSSDLDYIPKSMLFDPRPITQA